MPPYAEGEENKGSSRPLCVALVPNHTLHGVGFTFALPQLWNRSLGGSQAVGKAASPSVAQGRAHLCPSSSLHLLIPWTRGPAWFPFPCKPCNYGRAPPGQPRRVSVCLLCSFALSSLFVGTFQEATKMLPIKGQAPASTEILFCVEATSLWLWRSKLRSPKDEGNEGDIVSLSPHQRSLERDNS